jgi:hypothetical protein
MAGKEGAGGESSRVKLGIRVVAARGVVGGDGDFGVGFLRKGGGGIAFRSRSAFVGKATSMGSVFSLSFVMVDPPSRVRSLSWSVMTPGASFFSMAWREGRRRSHCNKNHGGCL